MSVQPVQMTAMKMQCAQTPMAHMSVDVSMVLLEMERLYVLMLHRNACLLAPKTKNVNSTRRDFVALAS
jgi:hypothetical protein